MVDISFTFPTFHPPIFWLNADAPKNILAMVVTELTSHPEISSLNVFLFLNREDMSVMRDVHQAPIGWPQVLPKVAHATDVGFREQSFKI